MSLVGTRLLKCIYSQSHFQFVHSSFNVTEDAHQLSRLKVFWHPTYISKVRLIFTDSTGQTLLLYIWGLKAAQNLIYAPSPSMFETVGGWYFYSSPLQGLTGYRSPWWTVLLHVIMPHGLHHLSCICRTVVVLKDGQTSTSVPPSSS